MIVGFWRLLPTTSSVDEPSTLGGVEAEAAEVGTACREGAIT